MSERFKVGQKMYVADMRDEVEVVEGVVVEVDRTLMRVVYGDGERTVWTCALSKSLSPWRPTRRAALERLRDETMSGVEQHEDALRIAREGLALVEAALEEVGDA